MNVTKDRMWFPLGALVAVMLASPGVAGVRHVESLPVSVVEQASLRCDDAGEWTFSTRVDREEFSEVISIDLSAKRESRPPAFDVRFHFSGADVQHVWTTDSLKKMDLQPSFWSASSSYVSQLAFEAPFLVALNSADEAVFSMAASEVYEKVVMEFGCDARTCVVQAGMRFFSEPVPPLKSYRVRIRLDRRRVFWGDAVSAASGWVSEAAGCRASPVPESAYEPLYSTWYAYLQNVRDAPLEREAELARELGMRTMILDDGWQMEVARDTYDETGDWRPAKGRFPDMRAHVDAVHRRGMKYMLWLAVPFVGERSEAYRRFRGKTLAEKVDGADGGRVAVLDPRFPEVRDYLVSTYERVLRAWDFDGVKLDFIDEFVRPNPDPADADGFAGRDLRSVPQAVDRLMKDVLRRLKAIKPDVLVEFRQHYSGPAIRQYGNMIRALDCPADSLSNRRRICDLRLSCGATAVHSDMLVWSADETAAGVSRSILSAIFGVVQYSMVLQTLPSVHREVIRNWLDFSRNHRTTLLKGTFRPRRPDLGYPFIEAESGEERILAVYLDAWAVQTGKPDKPVILLNATKRDTLTLRLESAAEVSTFDATGQPVDDAKAYAAGWVDVPIPSGGRAVVRWSRPENGLPEQWKLRKIRGRDLYASFHSGYWAEDFASAPDWPMMKNLYMIYGHQGNPSYVELATGGHKEYAVKRPQDGLVTENPLTFRKMLEKCPKLSEEIAHFEKCRPGMPYSFWFNGYHHPFLMAADYPQLDRTSYREWRAAHPAFDGFYYYDEWDNSMHVYSWSTPTIRDPKTRDAVEAAFPLSGDYRMRNRWTDEAHRRLKNFYFGEGDFVGLVSTWPDSCFDLGRKRPKLLFYEAELGSVSSPWRWGGAFIRGASRQFDFPFGWYAATYLNEAYTRNGENRPGFIYLKSAARPNAVEKLGCARSLLDRNVMYGYLIGANVLQQEKCWDFLGTKAAKDAPYVPSVYAEDFNRPFAFDAKHDRGAPYTPLAILVSVGESVQRQHYADANRDRFTTYAFLDTLVPPYEKNPALCSDRKHGDEGCMFNSPYGEIADMLCPDAGQTSDAFYDVLKSYPVAVVSGDFDRKAFDVPALEKYVRTGGILYVEQRTFNLYFDSKLLEYVPKGNLVVVDSFVPDSFRNAKDAWFPTKMSKMISGEVEFPKIKEIYERVQREFMPVGIAGDVQWGVNRIEGGESKTGRGGWLVWLVNNRGVTHYAGEDEIIDASKRSEVVVDLRGLAGCRVCEVSDRFPDRPVEVKNGVFRVTVDAARYRMFEISR